MKDIFNLTEEEKEKIFSLLRPIGHKEGDEIYRGKIIDGKFIEEAPEEIGGKKGEGN